MNQKEINVLTSITNDAATYARRITALTWELNRVLTEDTTSRSGDQTYTLNLARDAMARSGEEVTTAITILDRALTEARRALSDRRHGWTEEL